MIQNKPELEPASITIFGITGNLARKYLLPSLYDLIRSGMVPSQFKIIGVSRRQISKKDLVDIIEKSLCEKDQEIDPETINKMRDMFEICIMDISKVDEYGQLRLILDRLEEEMKCCLHRLYYLAVPPQIYRTVVDGLGASGLNNSCSHDVAQSRLLLEKPFGFDLDSAHELVNIINKSFDENQVYRVDHYLAKENAQNILTFRFENPLFRKFWDKDHIEYITITASETIGIEMRSNFYEQTGALRDFVQSHLLQLLCLATMDQPADYSAVSLRKTKLELLKNIKIIGQDEVDSNSIRGQYDDYSKDVGNPNTKTETYAAIKIDIDNDRWRGVPILLRTGKKLAEKVTEINFKLKDDSKNDHPPSMLTIRIQPNEGIALSLVAKKPGFSNETQKAQMQFCYNQYSEGSLPNAYEYVLVDAIRGDQSLFPSSEEVIRSWEIINNVVNKWDNDSETPEIYETGSWGPKSAEKLAKDNNVTWETQMLNIC